MVIKPSLSWALKVYASLGHMYKTKQDLTYFYNKLHLKCLNFINEINSHNITILILHMLLHQYRYDETLKVNDISILDIWVFWHCNNFECLFDGGAASGSLKIQVDMSGSSIQRSRFSSLSLQWWTHDSRGYGTQFLPPWAQNCFSWQVSYITPSIKFLPWLALFSLLY